MIARKPDQKTFSTVYSINAEGGLNKRLEVIIDTNAKIRVPSPNTRGYIAGIRIFRFIRM